jgi:membrane-bound inhibitor of C-type lysozyme
MIRLLPPLAVIALLAACSSFNQPREQITFVCDDRSTLVVEFDLETARITREDGKSFVLPQVPADSGFVYSTGRLDLRGTTQEIVWTHDTRRPATCRAQG